ncbi:MAG: hypothetical protein ACI8XV_003075 [Arenicella sp.]
MGASRVYYIQTLLDKARAVHDRDINPNYAGDIPGGTIYTSTILVQVHQVNKIFRAAIGSTPFDYSTIDINAGSFDHKYWRTSG